MDANVTLTGADYRNLIAACSKFPAAAGSFVGSDLIHLKTDKGYLIGSAFGTVLSRSRVKVDGELPLLGLDRRALEGFGVIAGAKVAITVQDKVAVFRGRREVKIVIGKGIDHGAPVTKNMQAIPLDAVAAERVAYLADVAFSDTSRAELSCVYMTTAGEAIALDQKIVAVLSMAKLKNNVAIPLPLARALGPGDTLYVGEHETVLSNGATTYAMPSAIKAQKGFPLDMVRKLGQASSKRVAAVDGERLSKALQDCAQCIGGLSKNEVVVHLKSMDNGKLEVVAKNGGVQYRAAVKLLECAPFAFAATLNGLLHAAPFMHKSVALASAEHGDLLLTVDRGWVLFPAWQKKSK